MLRLEGVSAGYGRIAALAEVSLEVREGELVSLIGANGAGKSTTLRTISGLLKLTTGRITLDGKEIGNLPPREILARGIAHCPEGRRVFPHLSVRENLAMGALLRRDRAGIAQDLEAMYARFPRLRERSAQAAGTLSGGEQQMLAIARALMSRPRLVMFDEPSLGLAPSLVEQVFAIVRDIRAAGTTVLMVEQNAMAALQLCDRAYLLETGHVVRSGTGAELLASPDVRDAYLGGAI
ncbi:ABC transporter ATP-binding protein [Belnapia rosea]|uniref:Amino acid/amide ABC transporter ATP-binding protein 2, HAAT family n=1 Tax=Belnapia rosea TaxID=938405 RepID=A0A1G6R4I6_9PROT|nr:ABC transporter ATP-binding protein [Belnapia rosea]SDB73322.1 branched-chain amino acid transport system ATP-binding protein [Belnapia rosea]SDC99333.1 amino acid/amide ABC transporter ATP-binding protein 2, HAAT family [Belnapia rosea]